MIPSQCSSVHSSFYLHVESLAVDSPVVRESIDIATPVDIVGMVPGAGGYSVQKSELFVLPVTIPEIRRPSSAAIKGVPVGHGSRVSLYYY